MSSESPLPQAYKKAAEADSHAESRPPRLKEAIAAHEEASKLFGIAEEQTEDDGVSRASSSPPSSSSFPLEADSGSSSFLRPNEHFEL